MSTYRLLRPAQCCLHIIDTQKSLMRQIRHADRVVRVTSLMMECAAIMGMPVLANTQYKKGLGPYVDELERRMGDIPRPDKVEFNSWANEETCAVFDALSPEITTVVMVGVETHICIYQSAVGALQRGLTPWIVSDGVSARTAEGHEAGLARLQQLGAVVGPAEMIIYELLGKAGTDQFKQVLPHIIAFTKENG